MPLCKQYKLSTLKMTGFTTNRVKVLTVSVSATFVSDRQLNLANALTLLGNSAIVFLKGELVLGAVSTASFSWEMVILELNSMPFTIILCSSTAFTEDSWNEVVCCSVLQFCDEM